MIDTKLDKKALNKLRDEGKDVFDALADIIIKQNKEIEKLKAEIVTLKKRPEVHAEAKEKVVLGKESDRFVVMVSDNHGYFIYDKAYANYGATNGILGDFYEDKAFLKSVVYELNKKISWDDKRDLSKPSELAKVLLGDIDGTLAFSQIMEEILEDVLCRL